MGKKKEITVKESVEELKRLKNRQKSLNKVKRVEFLLRLKLGKDKTRKSLSNHLCIGSRTLDRWISSYMNEGLEGFLWSKPRKRTSRILSKEAIEGIEKRIYSIENPFLGYWDVQNWLKKEYNIEVKYNSIRMYLVRRYGTKVKTPRKFHIKKDEQKTEEFLKNFRLK